MSTTQLPVPSVAGDHPSVAGPLPFVEAFGPTIQGEGPAAGRVADFLRFGGCNLSCSWCDSAFTWNAEEYNLREEITMMDPAQVMEQLPESPAPIMVVTGGEPLLNQRKAAFHEVLDLLAVRGQDVHIETNGTIVPNHEVVSRVDMFIVSPKLPHAGLHKRSQDPALAPGWGDLHGYADCYLKVVVRTPEDVATTAALARDHHWPSDRVWVMPEGITPAALASRWPDIATAAAEHGVNATHRLHVLAWNDERGH